MQMPNIHVLFLFLYLNVMMSHMNVVFTFRLDSNVNTVKFAG